MITCTQCCLEFPCQGCHIVNICKLWQNRYQTSSIGLSSRHCIGRKTPWMQQRSQTNRYPRFLLACHDGLSCCWALRRWYLPSHTIFCAQNHSERMIRLLTVWPMSQFFNTEHTGSTTPSSSDSRHQFPAKHIGFKLSITLIMLPCSLLLTGLP